MLLCINGTVEAVSLRGVTIITLEAMKPEALDEIRADDTTGKPVGMIGGVAKKEDNTLQELLLQRKDEVLLCICEAEALTG